MTNLKGIEGRFRALCDNGSQVNLITQAASQALGLKPEKHQTQLVGIGGRSLGSSVGEVMVAIKLRDKTQLKDIFYIVKEITTYAPNVPRNKFWSMLDGPLADEHYNQPGKIDALLGAGIWIRIIQQRIIREPTNQGIAQQTKIGYVLFENRKDPYQGETPYIGAISKGSSIQRLHDLIQQLWETEEIPQTKLRTKEENECAQGTLQDSEWEIHRADASKGDDPGTRTIEKNGATPILRHGGKDEAKQRVRRKV